tara:strand:+ start:361 stop:537 length:177 start_codon:yes stop_codon:yes gene_type:complete
MAVRSTTHTTRTTSVTTVASHATTGTNRVQISCAHIKLFPGWREWPVGLAEWLKQPQC